MPDAEQEKRPELVLLGDPNAVVCVGDSCGVAEHHEQSIVNRRLDEDLV